MCICLYMKKKLIALHIQRKSATFKKQQPINALFEKTEVQ